MVRLTDCLDMTIGVDWDVKPQIKQNKNLNIFLNDSGFCGVAVEVSPRKFIEFLREKVTESLSQK